MRCNATSATYINVECIHHAMLRVGCTLCFVWWKVFKMCLYINKNVVGNFQIFLHTFSILILKASRDIFVSSKYFIGLIISLSTFRIFFENFRSIKTFLQFKNFIKILPKLSKNNTRNHIQNHFKTGQGGIWAFLGVKISYFEV